MLAGRATLACKHRVADAFLASSSSPRCAPRSTFRQFLNCGIAKLRASLREFRAFYYPPVSPYFRPIHASRVYHRTLSSSPPSLRNNFITRICSLREEISKKVQASPLSFSRLQQLQFYFLSRDLPSIVKFISWRKKLLIRRKYRKILRRICIDLEWKNGDFVSKNRIGEDSRIA